MAGNAALALEGDTFFADKVDVLADALELSRQALGLDEGREAVRQLVDRVDSEELQHVLVEVLVH